MGRDERRRPKCSGSGTFAQSLDLMACSCKYRRTHCPKSACKPNPAGISKKIHDQHGEKRMKKVFGESVELDESKMYNVVDKKTGKVMNKKPMTTQQALDHYDDLGGSAKGLAVKPIKESKLTVTDIRKEIV